MLQTKKQKTKKKYNKKMKGGEKDYYIKTGYKLYPSGFVKLINMRRNKEGKTGLSYDDLTNILLEDNIYLYDILLEKDKRNTIYGNETEENIVNMLLDAHNQNVYNNVPNYSIEFDYKGKNKGNR